MYSSYRDLLEKALQKLEKEVVRWDNSLDVRNVGLVIVEGRWRVPVPQINKTIHYTAISKTWLDETLLRHVMKESERTAESFLSDISGDLLNRVVDRFDVLDWSDFKIKDYLSGKKILNSELIVNVCQNSEPQSVRLKELKEPPKREDALPFLALLALFASAAAYYIWREKMRRAQNKNEIPRGTWAPAHTPVENSGYLLVTWSRATVIATDSLLQAGGKLTPAMAKLVNECSSFKWLTKAEFEQIKATLREMPGAGEEKPEGTYFLGILHDTKGHFQSVHQGFSFDDREQVEKLAQGTTPPDFSVKLITTSELEKLRFQMHG